MALGYEAGGWEYRVGEHHIYGSSRLGVHKTDLLLRSRFDEGDILVTLEDVDYTSLYRGKRHYELSNHLGNVQVVVSDKRISVCDEELEVEYFKADVLAAMDYYPFGMMMPDRQWYANSDTGLYKFGFNGMERDNEVSGHGNNLDFGARIYDARLGRWLSLDPMVKGFPFISPYHFAANNPVRNVDVSGNILVPYDEHTREMLGKHFIELFDSKKNKGRMAALLTSHMSPDGSLNKITEEEFKKASKGLSPEQKQLARGYFEIINSSKKTIVLIAPGNSPIPDNFFPNSNLSAQANGKKVEDITGPNGGGVTVNAADKGNIPPGMDNVAASVLIQEDFDFSSLEIPILNDEGRAHEIDETGGPVFNSNGQNKLFTSMDATLNELIAHEIVGHALFGGVLGWGESAQNHASILVSNIYREDRNLPLRSGFDHGIGTSGGGIPNSRVDIVPVELKK